MKTSRLLLLSILLYYFFSFSLFSQSIESTENSNLQRKLAFISSKGLSERASNLDLSRAIGLEQDCPGAIPICDLTHVQTESYVGSGYQNELNGTCLTAGETNSVWYTFSVQASGSFGFELSTQEDYDFALYDITNGGCALISTTNPVRCNYSATVGLTGMNDGSVSPGNLSNGILDPPLMDGLTVTTGQTFVLVINNYTGDQNGYTLSFDGTSTIIDIIPPQMENLVSICDKNEVLLTVNEEVLCGSIALGDFTLVNTTTAIDFTSSLTSVEGIGCVYAQSYTTQLLFEHDGTLSTGVYELRTIASPGLQDKCGNIIPGNSMLSFEYLGPVQASIDQNTICSQGDLVNLSGLGGPPTGGVFAWSSNISTGADSENATANPGGSQVYSYSVTYGGCTRSDTTMVSLLDNIIVEINPKDPTICGGSIPLTATASIDGNPCVGCSFLWNTTETTQIINATAGTYWVEGLSPEGCPSRNRDSSTVFLASDPSVPTCDVWYVSPAGGGTGRDPSDPTTISDALSQAVCSRATIKMEIGDYFLSDFQTITSFITIDGGYSSGFATKSSDLTGSCTRIIRNASPLDSDIGGGQPRVTALKALPGTQDFKIFNLRIEVLSSPEGSEVSNYGIYLGSGCSGYQISRCVIDAGQGANGLPGTAGIDGIDGTSGENVPMVFPFSNGGAGAAGVGAAQGGNGGLGGLGPAAFAGQNGGGGALGGDGGIFLSVGCQPTGFCHQGTVEHGGDGEDGSVGGVGTNGSNGSSSTFSLGYFVPGGIGGDGTAGGTGTGGGGGGGAAKVTCNASTYDGVGGGGGGSAGEGGTNGTGGSAAGSAFGIFSVNAIGGTVSECEIYAISGTGGPGGTGGQGGDGGNGGLGACIFYGVPGSGTGMWQGGTGGAGGPGGNGGNGGNGSDGLSCLVCDLNGTTLTNAAHSNVDLQSQPVIFADNVNCTESDIDFSSAATSPNWTNIGPASTASLPNMTASVVDVQFSTTGPKTITFSGDGVGATNYNEFLTILLDQIPSGEITGPIELCPGNYFYSSSLQGVASISSTWSVVDPLGGSSSIASPNNSNTFISFTNAGVTDLVFTLQFSPVSECCGPLDTVELDVVVHPRPTPSIINPVSQCVGGTTSLQLMPSIPGYSYTWYDNIVGGNLLNSGTNYVVDSTVFGPTSVWVEAVSDFGCSEIPRVEGIITGTDTPPNTVDVSFCAPGYLELTVLTPQSTQIFNWYDAPSAGLLLQSSSVPNYQIFLPSIGSQTVYVTVTDSGCTESSRSPATATVSAAGTVTTWTGASSMDWFDPANWTDCVPHCGMDAVIAASAVRECEIDIQNGGIAHVKTITIESGRTLSFNTKSELVVCEDWFQMGNLSMPGLGRVSFAGSSGQQDFVKTSSATGDFNELLINNSSASPYINVLTAPGNQDMEISSLGILMLRRGLVFTAGNLNVTVYNTDAGSVIEHSDSSYVAGRLRRYIALPDGYDFPVGNFPSYQLLNFDMVSSAGLTYVTCSFNNPITDLTGLALVENSANWNDLLNNGSPGGNGGVWTLEEDAGSAQFNLNLYGKHYNNSSASHTIGRRSSLGSPWTFSSTYFADTESGGVVWASRLGYTVFDEFSILISDDPVVLSLNDFQLSGRLDGNIVHLQGILGEGNDTEDLLLQHALPSQDFKDIGKMKSPLFQYEVPGLENGDHYFRLKAVNEMGEWEYSNSLKFSISSTLKASFNVFPNPFSGKELTLSWEGFSESRMPYTLFDELGKVIYSGKIEQIGENGKTVIEFPNRISPGVYFLNCRTTSFNLTEKLIVVP